MALTPDVDGQSASDLAVLASRPSVPDEAVARGRLHHLGLLTSSFLRIDFCHAREHD
jgi:hypothetical protein